MSSSDTKSSTESPNRGSRKSDGRLSASDLLDAHVDRTGGEPRPQQHIMLTAVEEAIEKNDHLIVQAGTGTGKSLAYIFAALAQGKRVVVATATNQLSEQLINHDIPEAIATLETIADTKTGRVSAGMVKGRNNYVCQAKLHELIELDGRDPQHGETSADQPEPLFDITEPIPSNSRGAAAAMRKLTRWAQKTRTGDRTEAPPVSDKLWAQVSTTSRDCPGATKCPFGETCFTEKSRKIARAANIVVTNHAFLAQDMKAAIENTTADSDPEDPDTHRSVLGSHDVVVIDEAHDYPGSFTGALTTVVAPDAILGSAKKVARHIPKHESTRVSPLDAVERSLDTLKAVLGECPEGAIPSPLPESVADSLTDVAVNLASLRRDCDRAVVGQNLSAAKHDMYLTHAEQVADHIDDIRRAVSEPENTVAWVERRTNRNESTESVSLYIAPINAGTEFVSALGNRTLVATSATLMLGNDFGPLLRAFGLPDTTVCLDVGSPFNYPQQGMLYIPQHPFPEPVGKDRKEHKTAVLDELVALVSAAGGRTLALFTTIASAQEAADHLRTNLPDLDVYAHGDAPAHTLVTDFTNNETSVLCATMGLWQGVNVPGPSCVLVVIDKVGFAPPNDALTSAQAAFVTQSGGNGFRDVILAQAATSLAQAAGRLIRSSDDRGVVAILDSRLHTKSYGRTIISTLPPFKVFTKQGLVTDALRRLTADRPKISAQPKPVRARAKATPSKTADTGKPTRGRKVRRARTRKPL